MVAFDMAKVERALRGPLGDEAAREVTDALAAGLTDNLATKADLDLQSANLRSYALRLALGQLAITLTVVLGGIAVATAVILNALP